MNLFSKLLEAILYLVHLLLLPLFLQHNYLLLMRFLQCLHLLLVAFLNGQDSFLELLLLRL